MLLSVTPSEQLAAFLWTSREHSTSYSFLSVRVGRRKEQRKFMAGKVLSDGFGR